ncbi:MAG: hypothetical protein HY721_18340 [Planctomycetes bacterium]|nr:hypothetical protein [Planctomycetota bacterium]
MNRACSGFRSSTLASLATAAVLVLVVRGATALDPCVAVYLEDTCAREDPPPPMHAVFRLGEAAAAPGGEVSIPFTVEPDHHVHSYSISVDFDEEVLEALALERVFLPPEGQRFSFERYGFDNESAVPGNAGVDEGFLGALVAFDLDFSCITLRPDVVTHVLDLKFRVRPGVGETTTRVRFLDGARLPRSQPIFTTVGMCGWSGTATDEPDRLMLVDGLIAVVPDEVTEFLRADVNGDGETNISDAIHVLGHLFGSGPPVRCPDAADANDDGKVDISDPVTTLNYLFLGTAVIPPPFEAPGVDPTPDDLRCLPES